MPDPPAVARQRERVQRSKALHDIPFRPSRQCSAGTSQGGKVDFLRRVGSVENFGAAEIKSDGSRT
jgi:hypothetical protein